MGYNDVSWGSKHIRGDESDSQCIQICQSPSAVVLAKEHKFFFFLAGIVECSVIYFYQMLLSVR